MSGRGRGISNAPAWMTRQNKPGGGGSGDGPTGLPPANPDRDAFGRAPRGGGGPPGGQPGGGPPRYPPYHDRRGGPYDDRRRGSYDDRRRGGYDDRRRGGHDDWNNGPPGRRGGGRRDSFRDGGPGRDNNGGRRMNENSSSSREQLAMVNFRSYDEEQDWAEERRRRRNSRPSKFDVEPTPQQLAAEASVNATSNPGATDFAGIPVGRDFSAVPQQTRHARRLYIGHLPPNVHEQELHDFFRNAIEQARTKRDGEEKEDDQDPILSVYINHERRFCFLEFRDVGMTTACMAFDGINVNGKGKVKVKRPNDYNQIMAPKVHPSSIPVLDVSKLGIIGSNVQDGPNKVFIGGLHYHLTENQVLELLQAFGKIKAFHLVKNEPDAVTSKGYCFVEYADPNSTPMAVLGLNGMDMGGGKVLTARVAGQRGQASVAALPHQPSGGVAANGTMASIAPNAVIVSGYEIEALVDAAMGLKPMPTTPTHVDQFGMPITRMSNGGLPAQIATVPAPSPPAQPSAGNALPPGSSALDIANAALDAAFGPGANVAPVAPAAPPPPSRISTRILVLLNMVSNEDLESDVEYSGLMEEVEEEVRKFGKLLSIQIPRKASPTIEPSAVGKIFLEYATIQDSENAEKELSGRQFGPNVVQAIYHNEEEYKAMKLR